MYGMIHLCNLQVRCLLTLQSCKTEMFFIPEPQVNPGERDHGEPSLD